MVGPRRRARRGGASTLGRRGADDARRGGALDRKATGSGRRSSGGATGQRPGPARETSGGRPVSRAPTGRFTDSAPAKGSSRRWSEIDILPEYQKSATFGSSSPSAPGPDQFRADFPGREGGDRVRPGVHRSARAVRRPVLLRSLARTIHRVRGEKRPVRVGHKLQYRCNLECHRCPFRRREDDPLLPLPEEVDDGLARRGRGAPFSVSREERPSSGRNGRRSSKRRTRGFTPRSGRTAGSSPSGFGSSGRTSSTCSSRSTVRARRTTDSAAFVTRSTGRSPGSGRSAGRCRSPSAIRGRRRIWATPSSRSPSPRIPGSGSRSGSPTTTRRRKRWPPSGPASVPPTSGRGRFSVPARRSSNHRSTSSPVGGRGTGTGRGSDARGRRSTWTRTAGSACLATCGRSTTVTNRSGGWTSAGGGTRTPGRGRPRAIGPRSPALSRRPSSPGRIQPWCASGCWRRRSPIFGHVSGVASRGSPRPERSRPGRSRPLLGASRCEGAADRPRRAPGVRPSQRD